MAHSRIGTAVHGFARRLPLTNSGGSELQRERSAPLSPASSGAASTFEACSAGLAQTAHRSASTTREDVPEDGEGPEEESWLARIERAVHGVPGPGGKARDP
jgi:hypothetical protein